MKIVVPLVLLSLAACQVAQPDQMRNFADPAIAEALAEPMMSDVDLRAAAAPDALRPADQPNVLQIPADAIVDTRRAAGLGDVARERVREDGFSGCNPVNGHSAQWSIRLPDWVELPDGARVAEAVGSDNPVCALRVVRFGIAGTPVQAMARYAAIARGAGFVVTPGKKASLTAVRKRDGAAFHNKYRCHRQRDTYRPDE